MKQEDKELLLKDLCARLPYGVKLQVRLDYGDNEHKEGTYDADIEAIASYNIECTYYDTNMHGMARDWTFTYEEVKPYLRPMSSMTKKEKNSNDDLLEKIYKMPPVGHIHVAMITDWLLKRHFDIHDLISKGLALEAPEGMYNIKEK